MAGQTVTSGTTTANTVAQVTFTRWFTSIEIANSGSNDMWVRVDGVNPTVAGDDCQLVPAKTSGFFSNLTPRSDPGSGFVGITDVRMISSVSTTYTVSALTLNRGTLGSAGGGGGGGTVNQGTPAATSSAWPVKVIDSAGTNTAAVSAAGAVKVDGSAVTQPVSGSVTVSGTTTSNQGTAAATASAWPTKLVDSGGTNVASVSAAGAVKVDNSANTQPVSGTVTAAQGSPNVATNAWFTKITDGASVATLSSNGFTGNAISVQSGFVLSGTTLNSVSGNATGTAVDGGSARSNWTAFAFPTGTLTGTLTLELSDDGGNFVPSGSTGTLAAATNLGVFSTGRPARYARVSLSGASGSGTVLVRMMAAG